MVTIWPGPHLLVLCPCLSPGQRSKRWCAGGVGCVTHIVPRILEERGCERERMLRLWPRGGVPEERAGSHDGLFRKGIMTPEHSKFECSAQGRQCPGQSAGGDRHLHAALVVEMLRGPRHCAYHAFQNRRRAGLNELCNLILQGSQAEARMHLRCGCTCVRQALPPWSSRRA